MCLNQQNKTKIKQNQTKKNKSLFYGHPISHADNHISSLLATYASPDNSLTKSREFRGLEPLNTARLEVCPPMHNHTKDPQIATWIKAMFKFTKSLKPRPSTVEQLLRLDLLGKLHGCRTEVIAASQLKAEAGT